MRRSNLSGILAFAAVGIYYLYKNRDQVQRFFDQTGIPIKLNRLSDVISKAQKAMEKPLEKPLHEEHRVRRAS